MGAREEWGLEESGGRRKEREEIESLCPWKVLTHLLDLTSQMMILRSLPPEARSDPSALKASAKIESVCPGRSAAFSFPFSFPFPFPLAFGLILWNEETCLPVVRSVRTIVPSLPAVKSTLVLATADVTALRCPRVRR